MSNMKPSEKKGKKYTVLANIIKKPDRSLNTSGNRSFLNKSTSRYVTDLRSNNAKLAHHLASEKAKSFKLFRLFTDAQSEVMGSKAVLRDVSHTLRDALGKFRSGLDQLIQASDRMGAVYEKVMQWGNVAMELPPTAATAVNVNTVQPTTQSNTIVTGTVPSIRQCAAARPMVQGQVISNPTISLQRVNVPIRQLGKGTVKPARGVLIGAVDTESSRLSNVPEEINNSHEDTEDTALLPSRTSGSPRNVMRIETSTISLPPSQVMLERIASDETYEEHTAVHFGSLNFCTALRAGRSSQSPRKSPQPTPKKSSSNELSSPGNKKSQSPPVNSPTALISSNSDDYLTESSSDDEYLALKIAESKKSYLERSRQMDLKEGTSWNYDDVGKFRERPPKRRKVKELNRRKDVTSQGSSKTSAEVNQLQIQYKSKEKSRKNQEETTKNSSSKSLSVSIEETVDNSNTFPVKDLKCLHLSSYTAQNCTVLEEEDMSLTLCIPPNHAVNHEMGKKDLQHSYRKKTDHKNVEDDQHIPVMLQNVTQRPRGRKPSGDLSDKRNLQLENNENSPPKIESRRIERLSPEKRMSPSTHNVSQRDSYVVLERLPSNVIAGSTCQISSSVHIDAPAVSKRKKTSAGSEVSRNEGKIKNEDVSIKLESASCCSSPRKKGDMDPANGEIDVAQDVTSAVLKSKPGPKRYGRSKEVPKKRESDSSSLSAEVVCSAPTSPASSKGDSLCESRPRRHAAPSNLKEPVLNKKMRRE